MSGTPGTVSLITVCSKLLCAPSAAMRPANGRKAAKNTADRFDSSAESTKWSAREPPAATYASFAAVVLRTAAAWSTRAARPARDPRANCQAVADRTDIHHFGLAPARLQWENEGRAESG